MDALTALRSRRTVKTFSGAPLSRAQLETLLDAATWAPTHRMTQPWRFTVLDQAAIARYQAWVPTQPGLIAFPDAAKGAAKWAKLNGHLPGLGAMILVTWRRDAEPALDIEEIAATSAATQNLLIAATAAGIGSFWSTNPMLGHEATLRWAGVDPLAEGFLGALWLGRIAGDAPPPPARQPLAACVRWL